MHNNCIAHLSPLMVFRIFFCFRIYIKLESLCMYMKHTYGFSLQNKKKMYTKKTAWKTHKKKAHKNLSFVIRKIFLFWLYPAADDELERFEFCRTGIRDGGRLPLLFCAHLEIRNRYFREKEEWERKIIRLLRKKKFLLAFIRISKNFKLDREREMAAGREEITVRIKMDMWMWLPFVLNFLFTLKRLTSSFESIEMNENNF